ncbi:MAG TPA: hypothetical protein VM264_02825, partial [Acidimicrobiales bacterium]|nr:hypothetical protein [Acidimicrobiales bacterium]
MAEYSTGGRFLKPRRVVRVDLHGVSSFGPGDQHTLIRWERIEDILVAGPEAGHAVEVDPHDAPGLEEATASAVFGHPTHRGGTV